MGILRKNEAGVDKALFCPSDDEIFEAGDRLILIACREENLRRGFNIWLPAQVGHETHPRPCPICFSASLTP